MDGCACRRMHYGPMHYRWARYGVTPNKSRDGPAEGDDMEAATTCQARRLKAEDATIRRALRILANRLREPGAVLNSSGAVRDYLGRQQADIETALGYWKDWQRRNA